MARLARIVIPDIPHHVIQRGNRKQDVFFSDEDRRMYLDLLRESADKFRVTVWAWCLMTNHVHFIVVPRREDSLSKCFGKAHTQYTRRVNLREDWQGYLWQGRFASCPLGEQHVWRAVRYVERNPVHAGVVKRAWDYEWSSAQFHVGARRWDPLAVDVKELSEMVADWRAYLGQRDDEEFVKVLERDVLAGRPVGSEEFLDDLEQKTQRGLRRRLAGRPRKANLENW